MAGSGREWKRRCRFPQALLHKSFERILIETSLKHTGGRKGEAAELLGWGRNTLTRKLKVLLPSLADD